MTKETQFEVTYDMVYEWVSGDGHKSHILVEMIHELVKGKFDSHPSWTLADIAFLDKLRDEIITFDWKLKMSHQIHPNKSYSIGVWDMSFYVIDEDGNHVLDDNGEVAVFRAPNIDYSYMADGLDVNDLEQEGNNA